MQGKAEPPIKQTYFCQVVPSRYELNTGLLQFEYTPTQRIFANTVSLTNFAIYNQFPNLTQEYKSFGLIVNGLNYYVTMPQANLNNFWDIYDLCTIVETQLSIQIPIGTWSVTLSGNNNFFVLISNTSASFQFVYSNLPQQNQILRYLGFSSPRDPGFLTPSLSHLAIYPYSVQVTQNLNIQLKNTSNMFSDTIGVICQIPLNNPIRTGLFWQSPYYQFSRHILSKKEGIPIYNFQVQILDDNGFIMEISGQRMSATVVFEEFQID